MKFKNPFENKSESNVKENYQNKITTTKSEFSIWRLIFFVVFALLMMSIFFFFSGGITYFLMNNEDMTKFESNIDQTLFNTDAFTGEYLSRAFKIFTGLFFIAFGVIVIFLLIINGTKNVSTWIMRCFITHCTYFIPSIALTLGILYMYNFGENTIGYSWLCIREKVNYITTFLYPQEFPVSFQNNESTDKTFDHVLDYFITRFGLHNFVEEFDKFSNSDKDSEYENIVMKNNNDETKQLLKNTMASAVLEKYCVGHAFITSLVAVLSGMFVISQHEKPKKGMSKL